MKIFAKRKKKGAVTPPKPRTSFASDPLVEALLKKDPNEWNSKERRMVKRYEQRKPEDEGESKEEETAAENETNPDGKENAEKIETAPITKTDKEKISEEKDVDSKGNKKKDKSESSDSGSDDDAGNDSKTAEKAKEQTSVDTEVPDNSAEAKQAPGKGTSAVTESAASASNMQDGKVDPDHKIWKMLEKLNSKMKRTLSRKLDRQGAAVLDEVQEEANKSLGITDGSSSQKRKAEEGGQGKKKKQKKDLSSLPPEERVRREEQRRLQKEAVERRAKGEEKTPGHKHALNSERRRANRRKPKWKPASKPEKNEHHSSGFMVRKRGPDVY